MRLQISFSPQMIVRILLTPCHASVLILCLSGEVGIDIVPLPCPSPFITESFLFPNRPPPTMIGGEGNGSGAGAGALIAVRGEGTCKVVRGVGTGKEGFNLEGAYGTWLWYGSILA
jgi:hypothetical protein